MTDIRKARGSRRYKRMVARYRIETPLCEACKRKGERRAVEEIDHIRPLAVDPSGIFVWSNLQSLCKDCHADKTSEENSLDIPGRKAWLDHVEKLFEEAKQ